MAVKDSLLWLVADPPTAALIDLSDGTPSHQVDDQRDEDGQNARGDEDDREEIEVDERFDARIPQVRWVVKDLHLIAGLVCRGDGTHAGVGEGNFVAVLRVELDHWNIQCIAIGKEAGGVPYYLTGGGHKALNGLVRIDQVPDAEDEEGQADEEGNEESTAQHGQQGGFEFDRRGLRIAMRGRKIAGGLPVGFGC